MALSHERPEEGEWTEHRDFLKLEPRQRGACLNLALTALRRLGGIDALLAAHMTRRPKGSHRDALHLMRLGAAEILWLGTPAYAAVNAYVEITRKQGFPTLTGLVNAVLKRVSENGAAMLAAQDSARSNTPPWLWQRWVAAYGEEAVRQMAASHVAEPALDISVKRDVEIWAEKLEAALLPTGSLRRRCAGRVSELPGYAEGAWWVQDAAAALPVRLMGNVAGKRVLDMCAAPGGKTAQLCAAGASVTALDRSPARLAHLERNLQRLKLEAALLATDAREYKPEAGFDGVLLDAPCTATGTIRRHPEIAWMRTERDIQQMQVIQRSLLAHAATLVTPGGVLVYAVCSLEPEEGEDHIRRFLTERPGFRLLPADSAHLGIPAEGVNAEGMLRLLPGGTDGFFAAALRKEK